ncbi:MAG: hypothetical protein H6900_11330 [Rhodobacter sp.]|nr:hypothetical protein [Rhodobacter sp.]
MPEPRAIDALTGLTLPEGAPRRGLPPLVRFRTDDPGLRARYDDDVLYYSAVWLQDRGLLRLYGPRALNLAPLLARAGYATDRGPLPAPRLRHFKRYVIAEFALTTPADRLILTLDGRTQAMAILHQATDVFAGLNTVYTMSQNNDPDWIVDWMAHLNRHHGAEALLISDNASTAYPLEHLLERLRGLDFLKAVRILSVPFRYGPSSAICRRASQARFLQTGIANTNRDLYLGRARAVLSCDVDEIVVSNSGASVFDAARDRRLGVMTFPGYWRFAKPGRGKPLHADHLWIDPARARACPSKYALDPQGVVGRWSWMTHSLESLPRSWISGAPDFWFAHCHGISTRWKEGREETADTVDWQIDPALQALWDKRG